MFNGQWFEMLQAYLCDHHHHQPWPPNNLGKLSEPLTLAQRLRNKTLPVSSRTP